MNPRTHEDRRVIQLNVQETRQAMRLRRIQQGIDALDEIVCNAMLGESLYEIERTQARGHRLIERGYSVDDALRELGINNPEPAA